MQVSLMQEIGDRSPHHFIYLQSPNHVVASLKVKAQKPHHTHLCRKLSCVLPQKGQQRGCAACYQRHQVSLLSHPHFPWWEKQSADLQEGPGNICYI